jgi:hypothetical protein
VFGNGIVHQIGVEGAEPLSEANGNVGWKG